MTLFMRIRLHSNQFTAAQDRIVHFLQEHAAEAMTLPINHLAERCQVGDATVIRFYRLLGYENYHLFRVALARELSDEAPRPIYEEVQYNDGRQEVISKVIKSTAQSIFDLEQQLDAKFLNEMIEHLNAASFIHVIGLGASGVVAQDVMHKLMRLGLKIKAYTDSHLMTIAASVAQPDEVFFAISHSGETVEILRTVELANTRGCYTCALTSYRKSSITQMAGAYLLSCTRDTKMRSDAMISRIVQLVVIDILYVILALKMGDTAIARVNQSRLALKQHRNYSRRDVPLSIDQHNLTTEGVVNEDD